MAITQQPCSALGCSAPAVYRTRTKSAYCLGHVDAIFRSAGLEPVGAFDKPAIIRRCRCMACSVEADYRMVTVEQRTRDSITVCDACRWRAWAVSARRMAGEYAHTTPNDLDEVAKHASDHLFTYLGPLTDPSLPDDPHLTECQMCGVRSVQRIGDMGFICGCTKSRTRTSRPGTNLFKDSGSPALEWWSEDNDPVSFATVTMKANREVEWICPEGHRFSAPVRAMSETPRCHECTGLRILADQARIQAIAHLTVSQVPELAEAWDDSEYDPAEVMVIDDRPTFSVGFRWKCPNGHHPRLTISRWLSAGCSSCAGERTREAQLSRSSTFTSAQYAVSQRNPALGRSKEPRPPLVSSRSASDTLSPKSTYASAVFSRALIQARPSKPAVCAAWAHRTVCE